MKRETKLTFYTRFGWLMPWVVLITAIADWLFLMLPSAFQTKLDGPASRFRGCAKKPSC